MQKYVCPSAKGTLENNQRHLCASFAVFGCVWPLHSVLCCGFMCPIWNSQNIRTHVTQAHSLKSGWKKRQTYWAFRLQAHVTLRLCNAECRQVWNVWQISETWRSKCRPRCLNSFYPIRASQKKTHMCTLSHSNNSVISCLFAYHMSLSSIRLSHVLLWVHVGYGQFVLNTRAEHAKITPVIIGRLVVTWIDACSHISALISLVLSTAYRRPLPSGCSANKRIPTSIAYPRPPDPECCVCIAPLIT